MASRRCGFTRASSLGPIAGFVSNQGGSIGRIFQDAGLPLQLIDAPATPVPLKEQFRLLGRAARDTGDAQFGARLGQNVSVQNLGAFGDWVAAAFDLGGAIARAGQGLNAMLQTATVLRLERSGGMVRWSIELLDTACEGRYQHELLALSYMLDVLRFYAGRTWAPDLVLTAGPKSGRKGALEQIFSSEVLTGQPFPAILFGYRVLSCQRPYGPAGGCNDSYPACTEPPIPDSEDELAIIAAVTALSLLDGYPRLDWAASKLGMSRRTLQRRLSNRGTSFAELVERALRERAEALIRGSKLSLTAIGFELGYSDAAHFSRAFRKWTGVSPATYREQSQGRPILAARDSR
jgi:AraC-like DNA-binding protein